MESKATMKKECWVTVSNRVFFGYEPKRATNYTTPANLMIHTNRHRYALMLRADSFVGTSCESLKIITRATFQGIRFRTARKFRFEQLFPIKSLRFIV